MSDLMIDRDPRLREYAEAYTDTLIGLQAPPNAGERYRNALLPYANYWAETTPTNARQAMMEALFNNGVPLGVVLVAFRATEEEAELIRDSRPPVAEVPVDEIARLQSLSYGVYLKTAHWQKVRQEALERAAGRCVLCNSDQRLEVHHRSYERRGCERPADVYALCSTCHSHHHSTKRTAA